MCEMQWMSMCEMQWIQTPAKFLVQPAMDISYGGVLHHL